MTTSFASIIGDSAPMRAVKEQVERISPGPATTILLVGESGTGKGLIARVLHTASARRHRPFETVCCSALPETLLESELFGHEAGAFTDAKWRKKGLFEVAHGGTLFLDEIGETSLPLQVKLLRFLEDRTFKRLGATADIHVDVRVVAATNRDLERAVRERHFRADLYFRLNVLPLRVPSLRERRDDIPQLVEHFVSSFNRQFGMHVRGVDEQAMARLCDHSWPGNIRELRNVVERAMLLARGETLSADDLHVAAPLLADTASFQLPAEGLDLHRLESELLVQALERTDGNQSQAARLLGLTRHQIRYRMEKLGLSADGSGGPRHESTPRDTAAELSHDGEPAQPRPH